MRRKLGMGKAEGEKNKKMKIYTVITREHILTEKEIKTKLGLTGTIKQVQLWKGLSPNEEEAKKSTDTIEWCIETEESK